MGRRLRHLLIFLLIILKEPELPEAGCSCSISLHCIIYPLWHTPRTPCCNCGRLNLTSIPQNLPINISVISFLYLENNQITSFPQNLPKSITYLDLGHNQITSIQPGALSNLPQLDQLNLSENGITNIKPGVFSNHDVLWLVYLASNKITDLQTGAFSNLPKLYKLYLDDNQITSIQPGAFNNLPKLWVMVLHSNPITSIQPGTFHNLPMLEYLYLETNQIISIQPLVNLPKLQCLWLQKNQLSVLPQSAHSMLSAIKDVDITKNPWQCDCGMVPFRMKMTGSSSFEDQITCARPAKFLGRKLKDINPEDLICTETTISTLPFDKQPLVNQLESANNGYNSTPNSPYRRYFKTNAGSTAGPKVPVAPLTTTLAISSDILHGRAPSFPLAVLIGSICGSLAGIVLIGSIILTIWYKRRTRHPPSGIKPNVVCSNTNTTAVAMTNDQDHQYEDIDNLPNQTGQSQSQATIQPLDVRNLSHDALLAALRPNPMYAGVGTQPQGPTSTEMAGGHDQTTDNTSITVTAIISGHDQTGQAQATTDHNTSTTCVETSAEVRDHLHVYENHDLK